LEGLDIENLGIFYDHLVYFVVIWYIFPVLVFWTKKNLATLVNLRPVRYKSVRCRHRLRQFVSTLASVASVTLVGRQLEKNTRMKVKGT
jgi:hypothetical protein